MVGIQELWAFMGVEEVLKSNYLKSGDRVVMGRNHFIGALLGLASLFVSSAALGQAADAGSSGAVVRLVLAALLVVAQRLAVLRRPVALGSERR